MILFRLVIKVEIKIIETAVLTKNLYKKKNKYKECKVYILNDVRNETLDNSF